MLESIGQDRTDAINWVQDELGYMRHIAENIVDSSIREGKIIVTENGVFLTEDEEEEFKNNTRKNFKKYIRSRNHNHKKRQHHHIMNNKPVDSNDGVDAANQMLGAIDSSEDDENQ
jgi:hypothetical protein